MSEQISGTIERVTFHNLDNGFAVLQVLVPARRGLVTVVGHLPSAVAGEYVEAEGAWQSDRDHGLQFRAETLRTTPPHTVAGIEKYLGSGLVKGIGPHFAKKIVEVFGERTLKVIDESPTFLTEVKGIGKERLRRIRKSWEETNAIRSIMVFLQSHGVGTARAVRIYKTYGDDAIGIVKENPYRLATDIWGVGFRTADELAGRLGVARDSPLRARAAVRFVLHECASQGHVGFPEAGVVRQTAELTNIPESVIRDAIETERTEGEIVRETPPPDYLPPHSAGEGWGRDEPWIFTKPLFLAELGVARAIHSLQTGSHPLTGIDAGAAVSRVEQTMGIALAETQRQAITAALREKVLVITGGPGVGKTTIVRGIIEIFAGQRQRIALCAPTGRAAKRLGEATGREARTIHRLLEWDPSVGDVKRNAIMPLEIDLLVMDEASMADISLMYKLLRALPPWACVVLVGDVDQLPSVGPGAVLAELIASQVVPVVRLTEIFRQAGQSWIVRAAHAINAGEEPHSAPAGTGDFYFIEADAPETVLDRIVTMVRDRIPSRFGLDPFRDVQVLAPMNKSDLGVRNLNVRLQEVLNPARPNQEVQRFGWSFRTGDKVLQTENNYQKEVFNGDIGRVASIDQSNQELTVEFDGKPVVYDFGELDELTLAYAISVHKSQGAEYPAVLIPVHTRHFVMLQRNLLYTGVTRGKKLVVLVGSRRALARAVARQDTSRRCTLLAARLRAEAERGTPLSNEPPDS
jgi:exodeoxyribonuclease V alpha subunit